MSRRHQCLLLFVAVLAACTARLPSRDSQLDQPAAGLYEVVGRQCATPPDEPEDCSRTQYVELVLGTFFDVRPEELAFVVWLAGSREASNYTYNAGRLRGRFVDENTYVLDETPREREWLVLDHGVPQKYDFVRYTSEQRTDKDASTRLELKRIARTAELNRRLPYPEPASP